MEKVLQILLVFALMMLVIWRSIRGKEDRYRKLSYLFRERKPLPEAIGGRLIPGMSGEAAEREGYSIPGDADAFLPDDEGRLLFTYFADGKLTVSRWSPSGRKKELQELSVPMDCSALAWDPEVRRVYLEDGEFWYVYGPEG
ncbi:MAG TPA: hypothetical protein VN616_06085 [Puia sp.]|nr:hypothetical protein [Puia sp.]